MKKERVFGLDILRALAIIFVLMGHGGLFMPINFQLFQAIFIPIDAVTLFFVLSGFLIGRILINTFENEEINFRSITVFWMRRWFRTLPAYLTVLVLLALVYHEHSKRVLLTHALFLQNFNTPIREWFTESWSLSIEEWFYLITPLILFFIIKVFKPEIRKAVLFTCLTFIVGFLLYRLYKFYHIPPFTDHRTWDFYFRMQVTTRLDSIMYGVLAAYIYRYHPNIWQKHKNRRAIIGLIIIILTRLAAYYFVVVHEGLYSSVFSFSIESFGVLLIMPYFEGIKKGKGKIATAITFMSIISYSIYLLNFAFIGLWVIQRIPDFGLTGNSFHAMRYTVYWILSILASVCLFLLVEHPFLQLRNKWVKDKHPVKLTEQQVQKTGEANIPVSLS